jgi:hypothetical protein
VKGEELVPPPVSHGRRLLRGADDVAEEDRRQHALGLARRRRAAEKRLDKVHDLVDVVVEEPSGSRELEQGRARYVTRQIPALLDREEEVLGAMNHERRDLHQRQRRPGVGVHEMAEVRERRLSAHRCALVSRVPAQERRVIGPARIMIGNCLAAFQIIAREILNREERRRVFHGAATRSAMSPAMRRKCPMLNV